MESYKSLLDEHEALQRKREADANVSAETGGDFAEPELKISAVERFLLKVRHAGEQEELATRRETLRHIALTWADHIQTATGTRPPTAIADYQHDTVDELESPPAFTVAPNISNSPPLSTPSRQVRIANSLPALPSLWLYVGITLLALILILLTIVLTRDLFAPETPVAADTPLATVTAVANIPLTSPPPAPSPTTVPVLEITVVATNTPNAAGVRSYTVQSGDTLTSIATRFNVDVDLLRLANSLNTDLLQLGQTLWIPSDSVIIAQTPVTSTPTAGPAATPAATAAVASVVTPLTPRELVVRGTQGLGTATLRARPVATGEPITSVLPGTIALAVGRLADNSWYLLELAGSQVRGWLPEEEIGLIFPAAPENVPIIELP